MPYPVKIKVRPNHAIQFPALCVHCAQPGTEKLELRKRIGRVTRWVDVPLCAQCAQIVQKRSGDEERWQKIGWLVTAVITLLLLAIGLLLTPAGLSFGIRLLLVLVVAGLAGWVVLRLFHRVVDQAARPEKKAVLTSATIQTFSWRATTFTFTNETFVERLKYLNHHLLMEI